MLPCPAKPTAPVQQALSTNCDGGDALSEPFLVDAYGDAVHGSRLDWDKQARFYSDGAWAGVDLAPAAPCRIE